MAVIVYRDGENGVEAHMVEPESFDLGTYTSNGWRLSREKKEEPYQEDGKEPEGLDIEGDENNGVQVEEEKTERKAEEVNTVDQKKAKRSKRPRKKKEA